MPQPVTHVSSHLEAEVTAVAEIVLSVAVAYGVEEETLTVSVDGSPVAVEEVLAPHGTRLHVLRDVAPGSLVVDYRASVPDGHSPGPVSTEQVAADPLERITYLRPRADTPSRTRSRTWRRPASTVWTGRTSSMR